VYSKIKVKCILKVQNTLPHFTTEERGRKRGGGREGEEERGEEERRARAIIHHS
jgi:hypothetical protein